MSKFHEIAAEEWKASPFQMIGSEWMLVTAACKDKVNTMTASWGGLGILWGKNVAYIVIRPQRYTKEFIDSSDTLSLTFYDSSYKKQLSYLGTVSGRDEDKIAKAGLTVVSDSSAPYFEEAHTVLLCKKLYHQDMKPECFLEPSLIDKWYPEKDYHTLYVVEIEKILQK